MKRLIRVISATTLTAMSLTGCFNPADNRNNSVYGPAEMSNDRYTRVVTEASSEWNDDESEDVTTTKYFDPSDNKNGEVYGPSPWDE